MSIKLCWRIIFLIISVSANKVTDWSDLSFAIEPSDVVVRRDNPVWLHCGVRGKITPTVTWRRNSTAVYPNHNRVIYPNGTLHIRSATRSHNEGVYRCVASAPGVGEVVSVQAKLTIAGGWENGLPKFVSQPKDARVYEGDRALFTCRIQSLPPARIVWHRDGHQLLLDARMTLLPSGSLEIEKVRLSDEGEYYCHAVSYGRTKVSSRARLKVLPALALREPSVPTFIAKPQDFTGRIGQNVTLDCASNGYPETTTVWLKDGTTIDMQNLDSRFLFHGPTRSLQIIDLKADDEGIYTCRSENKLDSVNAIAHVQVEVPPTFTRKPENTLAYETEDVSLDCKVRGKPRPNVQWLKNGSPVPTSEFFVVEDSNLKIFGLIEEDSGMYQCLASNTAGEVQASAQLVILPAGLKPTGAPHTETTQWHKFGQSVVSKSNLPSAPRHLQHMVSSSRFITISWQRPEFHADNVIGYAVYYKQQQSQRERVQNVTSSTPIDGMDVYKTQIGNLVPASTYVVRVLAMTSDGLGESTKELQVSTSPDLDLPEAPRDLTAIPLSPTSLEVTWSPPESTQTPVQGYILYYMEVGSAEEVDVKVPGTRRILRELDEYKEYSVWVLAVNANGRGEPSQQVTVRTFSDVPSKSPQNVSIEPASSKSLIIRWEPPPPPDQNGIITGYKIRYKKKGDSSSSTKTTDGNWRLYALNKLAKNAQYFIKISAMTANGTGPSTHWIEATTFLSDLDESRVPDKPSYLQAIASIDSIDLRWGPPKSQDIKIRGYTIGWGKGFPDDELETLKDTHQRRFTLQNLEPNADYVISVRAFNNKGDGMPVYEQIRTSFRKKEAKASLTPPVGVKTEILTPFLMRVQWTDTTLRSNQFDRGHYIVKYSTLASTTSSRPKHKYVNVSDVTCLLDDLKPNTQYEVTVKVIRGRLESPWSLVVMNTTYEARPSSPPRDVTVVRMVDDPTKVSFNWQPPKQANGKITGYLIFYTTTPKNDWAMEEVKGETMTCNLRGLTPSTLYYYKMQARNDKGFGPFSTMSNFTTLSGVSHSKAPPPETFLDRNGLLVAVGCGLLALLIIIAVAATLVYTCRKNTSNNSNSMGTLTKNNKVEVKPPDLWIHHDQLELKNMDKSDRNNSPTHTTVLSHAGIGDYDHEDKNTTFSSSTLGRRTPLQTSYIRDAMSDDETDKLLNRRSFKPKPLIISLDANKESMLGGSTSSSVYSDGTLGRPNYALPHYPSTTTQNYHSPQENPYITNHASLLGGSCFSHDPMNSLSHPSSHSYISNITSPTGCGGNFLCGADGNNTLGKRPSNPLRSFSMPAPPQSAPSTPQQKHIAAVRPQGATSPFKKALNIPPSTTLSSNIPSSARRVLPVGIVEALPEHEEVTDNMLHGYSTEELNQEMANLEGLMKDLSNITTLNQFNC